MAGRIDTEKQDRHEARGSDASGLFRFRQDDTVTHSVRISVEPWVTAYVALMIRLSQTDRFKATLSTFIIDHGIKVTP